MFKDYMSYNQYADNSQYSYLSMDQGHCQTPVSVSAIWEGMDQNKLRIITCKMELLFIDDQSSSIPFPMLNLDRVIITLQETREDLAITAGGDHSQGSLFSFTDAPVALSEGRAVGAFPQTS